MTLQIKIVRSQRRRRLPFALKKAALYSNQIEFEHTQTQSLIMTACESGICFEHIISSNSSLARTQNGHVDTWTLKWKIELHNYVGVRLSCYVRVDISEDIYGSPHL